MSETSNDKQTKCLESLTKNLRIAAISIFGCFLTAICIILVVDLSERVYGKEQLQNATAFNLIGIFLASSTFMTTMGAGLSVWLVIDTAAEYKQLIVDEQEDFIEES